MTNSTRHMEFKHYQNSLQAKKSCSSPQQMTSTSPGPSLRRCLHCAAITSKPKAKSTAEQGYMCGQSTITCPPHQQSADSHKQQCFPRPSLMAHKQQCFPGPSAQPHSLPAITRPSLPKSLIPRPAKGKPCLARPSVLSRPPLPCHLGKLPLWIPCPPGVNKATTVFPGEEDLLLHLSTLVPPMFVQIRKLRCLQKLAQH